VTVSQAGCRTGTAVRPPGGGDERYRYGSTVPVVFEQVSAAQATDPALREALLALWVAVIDAGGSVGFTRPAPVADVARTLDAALARVAAGTDALGVLRDDAGAGGVAGMGLLVDTGSGLRRHWRTVLRVMVRPGLQGAGHGRRLMTGLHDAARGLGLEQLALSVRGGENLEGFYERLGYRVVGRHPGAIRVGPGDDRDEVMLVTLLT
jgi:GNAT superfamily N-acetyltransferase